MTFAIILFLLLYIAISGDIISHLYETISRFINNIKGNDQ